MSVLIKAEKSEAGRYEQGDSILREKEQLFYRRLKDICDIHCQLQRGVVFTFFKIYDCLPPHMDKVGKVCLLKALGFAVFP